MFVMNVNGGFANQLFRFACGYQISQKYNQEMVLHIYDKRSYVDAFLLDELCISDYKKIYMRIDHDGEKVREVLGLEKVIVINEANYECLQEDIFDENTLVYVDAPFQKPLYFDQYINDIRNMFQMRHLSEEMQFFKNKIQDQNSVAIHMRRRDFVDANNAAGEKDTNYFYKAAIAYFRKVTVNPVFYVFSDDIFFCIDFLGNRKDINFVKIPGGKDADIEEFFCVSWCTHRILTKGSSFGRMADLLNDSKDKITLYQGEEENKDHIVYLGQEKIKELYKEYENVGNKKNEAATQDPDSYFNVGKNFEKNILELYLEKAKRQYKKGNLEYAEQTLIKAWQYGFESSLLHQYYYRVLRDLQKEEEAYIEAVAFLRAGGEIEEIEKDFKKENADKIKDYWKRGTYKFFIIPDESYRNTELNQLCNLGILLQRMGNEVRYIFRKASSGQGINEVTNNEILTSNYMFTNCEGYMYQSKMYVWDIIEKQYDLNKFITSVIGTDTYYLITDNPCVIEKCQNRNLKKIYWKAINTYRCSNENKECGEPDISRIDRVVTDESSDKYTEKHIVIKKIPLSVRTDRKVSLSEQYAYDKEIFDVIEQVILRGDK